MEFDRKKILTVVTGSKELEGKAGWLGDTPTELMEKIKKQDPEYLLSFYETWSHPFEGEDCNYTLFYPAPPYAERQAEWVKENNVKVGTKVRFTKGFDENADGSICCEHRDAKGKEGFINEIFCTYLSVVVDGDYWVCPFTALEVIKEPTYRPFKNAEEFKPYRDKWCIDNLKGRFKIDWHSDTHIYEYGNSFITWEEAFGKYKFEDGTAFGIKEEA